ncbi:MAG TPA: acyltransferase [bacterium]|nr:acyltransferase [bacterium]
MKRIPIIDFVRFGSIFIVLGAHFFPQWLVRFIDSPLLKKITLNVFHNGPYGVTCFFVVSGFLITEILVQNKGNFSEIDLRTFYVKRAARILPLLGVVVLTAFCLEHSKDLLDARIQQYHVWNDVSGFGWPFWVSLVTFNFNWYIIDKSTSEGFQWNVLWSLAVEEQFYFCYPLIVKMLQNRKRVLIFLFCVVLSALAFRFGASFYFDTNEYWMQLPSFAAFDQIALGGILYFINQKWGYWFERHWKTSLGLMLAGMAACFFLCYSTTMHDRNQMIYVPTLMAASCALVLLGGLHVPALFSKTAQVLSWPGKLSYGCYLWHPTLIFLLMPILVPMGGFWGFIFLVLVVSFFAFLSYRYFEVPVNHRIRAWFKLKPSPMA